MRLFSCKKGENMASNKNVSAALPYDGTSSSWMVGSSGNTPTGAKIGDVSYTAGGNYRIVDPDTPGANYNPATGYYSVKITGDGAPPPQTGGGTASGYYNDYMAEYERILAQQRAQEEAAAKLRTQQTVDSINSNIPLIDQTYEQQQRSNYIASEKNKAGMGDYLSAMGYSGGMAESTALGLQTGYENNRRLADQEKNNALTNIQNLVQEAQLTGDTNLAQIASQYYQNYMSAMDSAQQRADSRSRWESEYALSQNQYNNAMTQQSWENQFAQDKFGYQKEQDALSNQLAQQRLRTTGGSSSSSSSTPTNNITSSGNYNTVLTNVKRALGGSNAGGSSAWNQAINYIQQSLSKGAITQSEAERMLSELGLK